jgi:hypothetical protein
LSACQERRHWIKSGVPKQKSDLDHAGCRTLAAGQAAREYDRELSILETTGDDSGSRLPRTFAKLDAAKREKKLFEACLGRRGYQAKPIKLEGPPLLWLWCD